MIWKPNVTVAAIIEIDGKFLMVEEESAAGPVLNQPAGHLEPNESMQQAVIRETLEETGHSFTPTSIVGSYLWHNPDNETTYFRTTYQGEVCLETVNDALDDGIIQALWMSLDEIKNNALEALLFWKVSMITLMARHTRLDSSSLCLNKSLNLLY